MRLLLFVLSLLCVGCRAPTADINPVVSENVIAESLPNISLQFITVTPATVPTPTNTLPPPPPTSIPPTHTPIPTATLLPTSTPSPTPTPLALCSQRVISEDDLLVFVTRDYPLSASFLPTDLVPLINHFSSNVTLNKPTQLRQITIEPLKTMIADMQAIGLKPTILSAHRSFAQQAVAQNSWQQEYPDRADFLSAPPGTSEHQLGTTVDFGSPENNNQFHTNFYRTSEGAWLLQNAHNYGFTLSYPANALEITQFYFEPWHYRYIGRDLATELYNSSTSLTEYQVANFPPPCLPDS